MGSEMGVLCIDKLNHFCFSIHVSGAAGGKGVKTAKTSRGALVEGKFKLREGEQLYILVGQAGAKACTASIENVRCYAYFCPGIEFGASSFCPVYLYVFLLIYGKINFELGHYFWIVGDRDFIFGMHTQLMKPYQMIPRSMLWPWPWPLMLKIANFSL